MSGGNQDQYFEVLKSATNRRQAAKIRDVRSAATLYLRFRGGHEGYVKGQSGGVYLAAYGRGGGLYMGQYPSPGELSAFIAGADEIRVVHKWRRLPREIRDPPRRETA